MPKVPAPSGMVVPMPVKPPEDVYFAMAAAEMDREGAEIVPALRLR